MKMIQMINIYQIISKSKSKKRQATIEKQEKQTNKLNELAEQYIKTGDENYKREWYNTIKGL